MTVGAGGLIPFDGSYDATGIAYNGGELVLSQAGVYMISLNMSIPACDTVNTTFRIRQNGQAVSGGALVISKECTSAPMYASVQTVIHAEAGDVLSVTTGACVALNACAGSDPIAVLTVAKIGC